jgi:hypothetical protein
LYGISGFIVFALAKMLLQLVAAVHQAPLILNAGMNPVAVDDWVSHGFGHGASSEICVFRSARGIVVHSRH